MKKIVVLILMECMLTFAAKASNSQVEANILQVGVKNNNIIEIFTNVIEPDCNNRTGMFKITDRQGPPGHKVSDLTTVDRMLSALLTAQTTGSPVILTYDDSTSIACWVWRVDIKKN